RRGDTRVVELEQPERKAVCPQKKASRTPPQLARALDVVMLGLLGRYRNKRMRVKQIASRGREQQAAVLRLLLEQAVDQLEAERERGLDQLGILVARVGTVSG